MSAGIYKGTAPKKEKVSLTEKLKFFRGRSRDMDLDHKKERGDKLKEKMPEHENR